MVSSHSVPREAGGRRQEAGGRRQEQEEEEEDLQQGAHMETFSNEHRCLLKYYVRYHFFFFSHLFICVCACVCECMCSYPGHGMHMKARR